MAWYYILMGGLVLVGVGMSLQRTLGSIKERPLRTELDTFRADMTSKYAALTTEITSQRTDIGLVLLAMASKLNDSELTDLIREYIKERKNG